MRLAFVGCGLLLLAALANSQVTESSSRPQNAVRSAPGVDRGALTFTRYQLNVTLNVPRHGFSARGIVVVRNDSPQPQPRIALQISSSLKWAAIRSGEASLTFTSDKLNSDIDHTGAVNEAVIELPKPLAPGESLELEVGYQGTIDQDSSRLQRLGMPVTIARRSDWDAIADSFTAVRGVGHVVWYPVALTPGTLDEGNKVFRELGAWRARHADSRFRVTFTEDSSKMFFANGERKSEVEKVYQMDRMGLEGPFFAIADYSALPTVNGRVLYLRGHDEAARKAGAALAKSEPVATSGKPFPAVVMELPAGWAGYENGPVLLTPLSGIQDSAIEQQLVHLVTHASLYSHRAWIYEGLAHMAQAMAIEQQQGRPAAIEFLNKHATAIALVAPAEPGPDDVRNSLINATDEIYYRSKAMWVWWMLREMVTTASLKKALAGYQADMDREPAYVQRLIEAASGKDLEWFFDDWVYRDRGLPDFRIVNVYSRENMKGTYLVTVTVENLGRAGAEVPVRIRMKTGETTARLVVKGKSQATVRIETALPPVDVIVNDGGIIESDDANNTFVVTAIKQ